MQLTFLERLSIYQLQTDHFLAGEACPQIAPLKFSLQQRNAATIPAIRIIPRIRNQARNAELPHILSALPAMSSKSD